MDYERWLNSAKLLPWIAAGFGLVAILVEREFALFLVPVMIGMFVATKILARFELSVGLFLALGWLSVACLLACGSAMIIAIARHEGLVDTSRFDWKALSAVLLLVAVATVYSAKVWKRRLSSLKRNLAGPECTKVHFFHHLMEPSQIRFWASPFALAAMSGAVALGSWVGYFYGNGWRVTLESGVMGLSWVFLIGSGIAQLMHLRDFRSVFSIRLV